MYSQQTSSNQLLTTFSTPISTQANEELTLWQTKNNNLKALINKLKQQTSKKSLETRAVQQGGIPMEFNNRLAANNANILELQAVVREQETVLGSYKSKFQQFEANLSNVMKLDKDIHSKLVNPQVSTTLQRNVRNVLVALNAKAPYEKIIKMVESIKV